MANAKIKGAVLIAQRWIAARLRNQTFFGLDELNAAIRPLLEQLNAKVTLHLGASRRDLFERLDQPALKPLPVTPYVYADWKECRAGLDYHIDVLHHYYSFVGLTRCHRAPRFLLTLSADTPKTVGPDHGGHD